MANNVTRYQPQTTVSSLPEMVNRLFNESFVLPSFWDRSLDGGMRGGLPVNLYETGDGYILQAALPGLSVDGVDIQVTGRDLTIKGTLNVTAPEGAQPVWRGIPSGDFYETYTLPVDIQSDKVDAHFDGGILWLTLPKAEHMRPKSIKVHAAK